MKRSAICLAPLIFVLLVCLPPAPARAAGDNATTSPAPQPEGAAPPAEAAKPSAEAVVSAAAGPGDRSAEYPDGLIHTVVEGDTLWDLSAKFLGSPWKWPELWERNRFLTNPHYIYPGIRLEVFPSPAKQYAAVPAPPPAAAPAAEAPKPPEEPPIPVPEKKEVVRLLDIKPADYVRAGEFLRERPQGIGAIVRGDEDRATFSTDDKVYLALTKDLPAGQMVGVYRVRGPVAAVAERTISGYVKYLVGVIQLLPKESGVPTGTIRASFEDLLRSDLITEEIPAYAPVPLKPGADGVEATVISGRNENSELAAGNFIYLSRGSAAGAAPGNTFRLYDVIDAPKGNGSGGKLRIEVGKAVVVKTSSDFATAYITESLQSFSAGALARGGADAAAR